MSPQFHVVADLEFEVTVPGRDAVHGTLRGRGSRLELHVDDPRAFAGRADAAAIRALADGLARHGMRIRVWNGEAHLVTLGAVRGPWWQRRFTRSRHIRLGSLRGAWASTRSRSRAVDAPVLPDRDLAPPGTLLPLAPTFLRRPRREVTTTHDPSGGGQPRLILAPRDDPWPGDRQPVFWLTRELTTIGSDETCHIRLPGLEPLHAEVRHDSDDEFVISSHNLDTRVNGEPVRQRIIRTASRVEVGSWTLTFYREEYADHGRPYGGRIGGELGHQKPQPPRSPRHHPNPSETT